MTGPKVTFAVERYVTERARRGELTKASATSYRERLRMFVRLAELNDGQTMSDINKTVINRWWSREQGSPTTVRNRLAVVRSFIGWGLENEWIKADPTRHLKSPKEPRRLPVTLTGDEVAALLAVVPDARGRLIVQLGVQLGLRRKEIAGLRREHVDVGKRLVYVMSGKGGHERVLPLVDEVLTALRAYYAESPGMTGPLLRHVQNSSQGLSPGLIGNLVREWMLAAGVKATPLDGKSLHALRRTAATDLLDGGAHVRQVQAVLGHSQLASTERYLRRADAGELRTVLEGRRYGAAAMVPAIVVADDGCVSFS